MDSTVRYSKVLLGIVIGRLMDARLRNRVAPRNRAPRLQAKIFRRGGSITETLAPLLGIL